MGVIIWGLFNPVGWVMPWGLSNCYPIFSLMSTSSCALAVDSSFLASSNFLSSSMEGMKPPLYGWQGSLFWWVGVFCIREVDRHCHSSWCRGYLPISLPPFVWPCQLWPSSVSGCIQHGVHYLPASMDIDIIPSALHMCSFWGLQPHHLTCGLYPSSVDALVDIHGRSQTSHLSIPGKLCW